MAINKVHLHGRLTKDVEARTTSTGKTVASFTLAVDRPRSKDGQQTADFIPCVAWGKLADVAANNLFKGKEVVVEGRMQVRSYEAQDGSKRYVTEVVVNEIDFCGKKSDSMSNTSSGNQYGEEVDEEIPF